MKNKECIKCGEQDAMPYDNDYLCKNCYIKKLIKDEEKNISRWEDKRNAKQK